MAADVIQLAIMGSTAGQPVANFLHYQSSVADPEENPLGECIHFIDAWETALKDLYLDMLPDDYRLHGFKCRRVNNTGGPTAAKPVSDNGTRGENAIASGSGPVIVGSFYTGTSWKTSRLFVPGVAIGDLVGNEFAAALLANVQLFINGLNAVVSTAAPVADWTVGVYGGVVPAFHEITEHAISLVVGTQRRRYRPV